MQLFLRILPGSYYSLIPFVQKRPNAKSMILLLFPTLTVGIVWDSLQYDGIITLKEIVFKSLKGIGVVLWKAVSGLFASE